MDLLATIKAKRDYMELAILIHAAQSRPANLKLHLTTMYSICIMCNMYHKCQLIPFNSWVS